MGCIDGYPHCNNTLTIRYSLLQPEATPHLVDHEELAAQQRVKCNMVQYHYYQFPEEKLGIIRQTTAPGNHVYWIDDLSYNHEHGEVRYYSHLIERIKETRIRYFPVLQPLTISISHDQGIKNFKQFTSV